MADVPLSISSALDTHYPLDPEDYTHWELDDSTRERLERIEQKDSGTWDLRGDQ